MGKNYCPYCMALVPEGGSCSVCGLTSGTYVPSPHHLPPGTVLMNRYLVGRVLGEGGFGITYIGRDLRLELKVAIKEYYPVDRATRNASASLEVTNFIGPSAKSFERGKQKFLGEAQVMARMDKQQVIVSVRDFFEINNTAYIVMEYIEGITFHELVEKKGGKIPPEELFPMIEPLFHALTIMHGSGLIHRDISPDNLMLENGRVRLLDFGCAREASRGTETMTIALKHGYAPIEQYQQKGQGPWTDIYALSATIYYCLTGKTPPQALDRITEDELLLPSKLGIPLSASQEKALLKGMKLQPNRRFATAEEMWGALYAKADGKAQQEPVSEIQAETQINAAPETPMEAQMGEPPKVQAEVQEYGTSEMQAEAMVYVTEQIQTERQEDIEAEDQDLTADGEEDHGEFPERRFLGPLPEKTRKICLAAGALAAVVLIVAAVWRTVSKEIVVSSGMKTVSETRDGTPVEKEGTEEKAANGGEIESGSPDPAVFEQAYTFTSGDGQAFQNLMKDNGVSAIIIACSNLDVGEISITKPLLVAKDAYWAADHLTVEGNGYLQIEGQLDLSGSSYLRLVGKELRLHIVDGGELTTEDTLLWMDDECCFGGIDREEISGHVLVLSEDVFEGEQAKSVTDSASLLEAMDSGCAVSIDADITLDDHFYFQAPVRISEGVTVASEMNEDGRPYSFCIGTDGVLVNNGTFLGDLSAQPNGVLVNNGTYGLETHVMGLAPSLWFENGSLLVNFGTVYAQDTSRIWENTLFFNMGTMFSYDFFIAGGKLTNYGSIILEKPEHHFENINNGILRNKKEALVTVSDSAELWNNGRIYNQGSIMVSQDGLYQNAVLSNDGVFQVSDGGRADQDRAGIYYGSGEFLTGNADVKPYQIYDVSYYVPECWDGLLYVRSAEELEAALEDPEAEAVCVKADILVEKDLTIRKPLFIDQGCSLSLSEEATLLDYGNCLMILDGGTLQGSDIVLYEDAQIYMEEHAVLAVNEGGMLTMDSSLLWGNGGCIKASGADFILKNSAGFAMDRLELFEAANGKIIMQDEGVFVTPYNGMELHEMEITMEDNAQGSYFYAASDLILKDCSLDIGAGSLLRNSSGNLTFQNCRVMIGEEGGMDSSCANLSLLSGTALENRGFLGLWGWDEYSVTVHGKIVNFGNMELGLIPELSEPINNQGNLSYFDSYKKWDEFGLERYVIGNAPVDRRED